MVIGGHRVPVANLPYTMASDAAGAMAEDAPFAACYFDRADARVFSLRSRGEDGLDVSEIAARYGGERSAPFVNGLAESLARRLRPAAQR